MGRNGSGGYPDSAEIGLPERGRRHIIERLGEDVLHSFGEARWEARVAGCGVVRYMKAGAAISGNDPKGDLDPVLRREVVGEDPCPDEIIDNVAPPPRIRVQGAAIGTDEMRGGASMTMAAKANAIAASGSPIAPAPDPASTTSSGKRKFPG